MHCAVWCRHRARPCSSHNTPIRPLAPLQPSLTRCTRCAASVRCFGESHLELSAPAGLPSSLAPPTPPTAHFTPWEVLKGALTACRADRLPPALLHLLMHPLTSSHPNRESTPCSAARSFSFSHSLEYVYATGKGARRVHGEGQTCLQTARCASSSSWCRAWVLAEVHGHKQQI